MKNSFCEKDSSDKTHITDELEVGIVAACAKHCRVVYLKREWGEHRWARAWGRGRRRRTLTATGEDSMRICSFVKNLHDPVQVGEPGHTSITAKGVGSHKNSALVWNKCWTDWRKTYSFMRSLILEFYFSDWGPFDQSNFTSYFMASTLDPVVTGDWVT